MDEKNRDCTNAKLGFGFMRLPKNDGGVFNMSLVKEMVDVFLAEGFTYFDTAYLYPGSEDAIRKAVVERYSRDRYTITSKLPISSMEKPGDAVSFFEASLMRTGVEYFDYYLIHAVNAVNPGKLEDFGTWRFLSELKSSGRIKNYGFSFHSNPEVLEDVLSKHPDVDIVQLQINYLDWEDERVQARRCYEVARAYGVPIAIMEPIKGGLLADIPSHIAEVLLSVDASSSPASWALRFAASLEGVSTVLSGMNSLEQMRDNTATMKSLKPLSKDEQGAIARVVEEYLNVPRIPCTDCKYCVNDCTKGIRIPNFIELYNDYITFNTTIAGWDMFSVYTLDRGKPSDCIQCRVCEGLCPQGIEIADVMKRVAEIYD